MKRKKQQQAEVVGNVYLSVVERISIVELQPLLKAARSQQRHHSLRKYVLGISQRERIHMLLLLQLNHMRIQGDLQESVLLRLQLIKGKRLLLRELLLQKSVVEIKVTFLK